jgi:isoleucyl-tRNA synthetase
VPIPFFVHKETGELHPDTDKLVEDVALHIEQKGIEAWFTLDKSEWLGEQADQYDKTQDTLDVWFDSGVTHEAASIDIRGTL